MTERDLVSEYRGAKAQVEAVKQQLEAVNATLVQSEQALVEYMMAKDIDATADYADVGKVTMVSPQLYASVKKENEQLLFDVLKQIGREDIIKTTVHSRTLSSWVKERIENGEPVPECVTYYQKPVLRLSKGV